MFHHLHAHPVRLALFMLILGVVILVGFLLPMPGGRRGDDQ